MDDDIVWAPQTAPPPAPVPDHSDIVWTKTPESAETGFAPPPVDRAEQVSPLTQALTSANPVAAQLYATQGTQPVRKDGEGRLNYRVAPQEIQDQIASDSGILPRDQSAYITGYDPDTNKLTAYERNSENSMDRATGLATILAPGLATNPVIGAAGPIANKALSAVNALSPEIKPTFGMVGGPFGRFVEGLLAKAPLARGQIASSKAAAGQSIGKAVDELTASGQAAGPMANYPMSDDQVMNAVTGNKLDEKVQLGTAPAPYTPGTSLIDGLKPKVILANNQQLGATADAVNPAMRAFNAALKSGNDSAITAAGRSLKDAFSTMTPTQNNEGVQAILNAAGRGAKDDLTFSQNFRQTFNKLPPQLRQTIQNSSLGQSTALGAGKVLQDAEASQQTIASHGAGQSFNDLFSAATPAQKTAIQGTVLGKLGRTPDINGDQQFLPKQLVQDWDGISNSTKTQIFPPNVRSNFDNLVNLSRKIATKPVESHSQADVVTTVAIEHVLDKLGGLAGTAATIGAAGPTAWLLSKPGVVRAIYSLHASRNPTMIAAKSAQIESMLDGTESAGTERAPPQTSPESPAPP